MNAGRYLVAPCLGMLAVCLGCGVPGIPKPPSLKLPQPVTDLKAVRKGDKVYLAWTAPAQTTDFLPIRNAVPTKICRSIDVAMKDCGTPLSQVTTAQPAATPGKTQKGAKSTTKIRGSYVDALPKSLLGDDPSSEIYYGVSALNDRGRSAGLSNPVAVPGMASVPPPTDFHAQVTANGVLLSWTGNPQSDTPRLHHLYRVYRRLEGTKADAVAGEMPFGALRTYLLLDHGFEWEKTYQYRMTVVDLINAGGKAERQFEGEDTAAVRVFAHDTFPPGVPSGLQAVFSGAGQQPFIDLIWAPDADPDLAGYNVYRRDNGGEAKKINADLVTTPAFRDSVVAAGHTYSYSVSAVDVHRNESAPSLEASERVP